MKTKNKILAIAIIAIMMLAILLVPVNSFAKTITIGTQDTNANLVGKTVYLIKLFNATGDETNGFDYTFASPEVASIFAADDKYNCDTVFEAVEYVKALTTQADKEAFADSFFGYASSAIKTQKTSTDGSKIEFIDVTDGYFLIYDQDVTDTTPRSAAILTHLKDDNTIINLKAEATTFEKTVAVKEGASAPAESAYTDKVSAEIGDTVSVKIKTNVPNTQGYAENGFKYTFEETIADGLNATNVKVKIGDTDVTEDVTITRPTGKITIDMGEFLRSHPDYLGEDIVITYDAKLVTNAKDMTKTDNNTKLTYSVSPNTEANKTTEKTIDNKSVGIYTYTVDIKKINNSGTVLPGAEFEVYKAGSDTAIKFILIDGIYVKDDGVNEGEKVTKIVTALTEDANKGTVKFAGLEVGSYSLKETKAPTDYSIPADSSFEFTISATDVASPTFSFDSDEKGFVVKEDLQLVSGTKTFAQATVKNAKKGNLPETGGMGTVMFTVVGIAVMAVAFIAIVARNKRNQEN